MGYKERYWWNKEDPKTVNKVHENWSWVGKKPLERYKTEGWWNWKCLLWREGIKQEEELLMKDGKVLYKNPISNSPRKYSAFFFIKCG